MRVRWLLKLALYAQIVVVPALFAQTGPDNLLLKNYRPKSIYKVPVTDIKKAKYPAIDMHSHAYTKTPEAGRSVG